RLERALGQFMLDVHTTATPNYTQILPPLLVGAEAKFGPAPVPRFDDRRFWAVGGLEFLQFEEQDLVTLSTIENGPVAGANFVAASWTAKRLGLIPTAEVPL